MPLPVKETDLVYFPVPKAACTSIKFALINHNEDGLADRMQLNTKWTDRSVHRYRPSVLFRPWHPLIHGRQRWFCVVRDPIRRFLSAYGNRVVHHGDLKHSDPAVLERAGLVRTPDLETFIEKLEAYCAANGRLQHHIRPQADFLGRRPERYDRIFSMSELGALPDYLAAAGAPITLPHQQTKGPKIPPETLSAVARAKLEQYYRVDFSFYGAYFDG